MTMQALKTGHTKASSTFQLKINNDLTELACTDGIPTEVCTQFKDKKWGPTFLPKRIFLLGLNGNFAVDKVFEKLVSTDRVH